MLRIAIAIMGPVILAGQAFALEASPTFGGADVAPFQVVFNSVTGQPIMTATIAQATK